MIMFINIFVILILFLFSYDVGFGCENQFEGFGIHLGSLQHFNSTDKNTIQRVIDILYSDLKIRHFRTSYESYFSPAPGIYNISCTEPWLENCTWSWEEVLSILSDKDKYPHVVFIASVWSPPIYMMNIDTRRLIHEKEMDYYYYLKNITQLIQHKYNISVEKISPVNEPENMWATWDHCNMDPAQLCSMVKTFNDSLISLCPENSYFWMTELYLKYKNHRMGIDCLRDCTTAVTHAYALNSNSSSINYNLAYYDLTPYENPFRYHHKPKTIWVTEVSSTYVHAEENQMQEALDLATNIINFIGRTCVERYYFWSAFTRGYSGESLIWGISSSNNGSTVESFHFPKTYWTFNHFTNATMRIRLQNDTINVRNCDEMKFVKKPGDCISFIGKKNTSDNTTVFINREERSLSLRASVHCPLGLVCTTGDSDLILLLKFNELPPKSICSCVGIIKTSKYDKGMTVKKSFQEQIGHLLQYYNFDRVMQLINL